MGNNVVKEDVLEKETFKLGFGGPILCASDGGDGEKSKQKGSQKKLQVVKRISDGQSIMMGEGEWYCWVGKVGRGQNMQVLLGMIKFRFYSKHNGKISGGFE